MRNYWTLTNAIRKSSKGSAFDGKSSKLTKGVLYSIILVLTMPSIAMMYIGVMKIFDAAMKIDQHLALFCFALFMGSILLLVAAVMLVPSLLYFSKDTEFLLALPLKPQTIINSRLSVAYLYEMPFLIALIVIIVCPYIQVVQPSMIFYLWLIPVLLTLPIVPLLYASIISVLIMRFLPIFKNKDRFNLFSGIFIMAISFTAVYFFNQMNFSSAKDVQNIILLVVSGSNSLVKMMSFIFPNIALAANGLINSNILLFISSFAFCIVLFLLFQVLAKFLYLKGIIGINETQSKKAKICSASLAKANMKKGIIYSYFKKELKLLYRSPAYLTNCISICFIFPIMILFFGMFQKNGNAEFANMIAPLIAQTKGDIWGFLIMIGLGLGFLANMNSISITAISREGSNIHFMKSIPIPYSKQIVAKILNGMVISLLFNITLMGSIAIMLPLFSFIQYFVVLLTSLVSICLFNYIAIYIDLAHPKLVWENEITPVKQNFTAFLGTLFSMISCFIIISVALYFNPHDLLIVAFIIIAIFIIITVFLHLKLEAYATKQMECVCE